MRLAVFALLPDAEWNRETTCWLESLIRSLAESSTHQVVLYTNAESAAGPGAGNLRMEQAVYAPFFLSRWRQHRHWRQQLQAQNIQSVLFFGLLSVFATALPSALILQPNDMSRRRLLQQAVKGHAFKKIFVASHTALNKVTLAMGSRAGNITVLHGAPPVRNLVAPDTQFVKDLFTDGAAYFLCYGSLSNTDAAVLLLKAFSRFKRRQKSGWMLVLIAEETNGKLGELLATYKYRHDVVTVHRPGAEVAQALYAGAYCFVQPGAPGYFGTPLLRALSWGLPLIATEACREWAGAAALYFEAGNEEGLAEHLMALYKDEALQQKLAQAAVLRATDFSWQPLMAIYNETQPATEKHQGR